MPLVFSVAVLIAAAAIPSYAEPIAPRVRLRAYNYAKLAERDLAVALGETASIFQHTAIALEWRDCAVEKEERQRKPACVDPIHEGRDFVLRLMASAPATPGAATLGTSMLDGTRRGGTVMTLEVIPIRSIAEGTSISWVVLLGRAIAHEIGHLLLGTAEHPKEGVMRALWSLDELRGHRPTSWRFSASEAARMRKGLGAPRT